MVETTKTDDLVGQVVEERYRIEALLGSGAMGVVYRARHVKVGREVAIKVLHDHLVRDPVMVARFDREAAIAARLDHPNLINVIDVGETGARQKMMVLQLARGETLAELLSRGPLDRARIVNLVRQLLCGLEHAHAAGLVHRDLKPENVIVEVDSHGIETPKIVDFGIAVLRDTSDGIGGRRLTASNVVLGTPAYMAPEHAHADAPDARSDLFALGVIVYEMLAGKQPFAGNSVEVILANISQDPPSIVRRSGFDVDPLLEAFARRLMARRIHDRFQSARDALNTLDLIQHARDAAAAELGIVVAIARVETSPIEVQRLAVGTAPPPIIPVATVGDSVAAPVVVATTSSTTHSPIATPPAGSPGLAKGTRAWPVIGGAFVLGVVATCLAARSDEAASHSAELHFESAESITIRSSARTHVEPAPREVTVLKTVTFARPRQVSVLPTITSSAPALPEVQLATTAPLPPTDLVRRYVAVGEALKDSGEAGELRARYRRIRINDALQSETVRDDVLRVLGEIERGLDVR